MPASTSTSHAAAAARHQRLAEFRCSEILVAASTVFAAQGFDAATVDEIAAAAGVAKGTLYLYYPSKRDIYWAVLRDRLLELHALLDSRLDAAHGVREVIRAFVETKITYYDSHRDFFRIVHAEFGSGAQTARDRRPELHALIDEQVALLEAALARVARRTRARLPHREVAFALAALTRGLVVRRFTAPSPGRRAAPAVPVAADVDFVLQLLLPGIEGHGQPRAPRRPMRSAQRESVTE
jgi:AcrR family transcriptional regulator